MRHCNEFDITIGPVVIPAIIALAEFSIKTDILGFIELPALPPKAISAAGVNKFAAHIENEYLVPGHKFGIFRLKNSLALVDALTI